MRSQVPTSTRRHPRQKTSVTSSMLNQQLHKPLVEKIILESNRDAFQLLKGKEAPPGKDRLDNHGCRQPVAFLHVRTCSTQSAG